MKKFLSLIVLIVCFQRCDFFERKKLYHMEIRNSDIKIEWYMHSFIRSFTPDYLTISMGDNLDTIYVGHDLIHVELQKDSVLKLWFNGEQNNEYPRNLINSQNLYGYSIVIDSVPFSGPKFKGVYKRDN